MGFYRYWRKPDKTAEVFHIDDHGDLWFRSGDIGAMDEQSFVYILDRAKDIIIQGGENISCAEVEQADDGVFVCNRWICWFRSKTFWGIFAR